MSAARAFATIDVGTNTTLLLVARPRPGRPAADAEVLAEAAEITRLGRGIGADGKLGDEGIARTLEALDRYSAVARTHQATVAAIGTEALRRAPNAGVFLDEAARRLGVPVEVIDGEREAALTFRAVAESFPAEVAAARALVVDIGGGSTELVVSERGAVTFRRSLPIGSVRLHERHVRHDPPETSELRAITADVEAVLETAAQAFAVGSGSPGPAGSGSPSAATLLVGVAGTVTSLSAMSLGLRSYDPARVHGSRLGAEALEAQIARLARATQAEREQMAGLDPKRADVILAGALILQAIVRRAGAVEVRVSDRGIRWGLFYELTARAAEAVSR
jgi:exopolyphosphatase/guanosine-5'-triphosphate,3'-diphosphate pyrophosphatase